MNGEQHGEGTLYMADGRTKEGIFENNRFVERKKVILPNFNHETAANQAEDDFYINY